MPMTSFWCFSIKRFGTQFAGAELFFSMKSFYSTNRVLSAHRARHGRPHLSTRRFSGSPLHRLPTRLRLCRARTIALPYVTILAACVNFSKPLSSLARDGGDARRGSSDSLLRLWVPSAGLRQALFKAVSY